MNSIRSFNLHSAIFLIFSLASSSSTLAQSSSQDFSGCLPPLAGVQSNGEDCSLTYTAPPLLRQDILVTGCSFLPGQFSTQENNFKGFQCSVVNETQEHIESFRYGVRYFSSSRDLPLAEGGFEETQRFSTANINGNLQPGEQRAMNFVGPNVPIENHAHETEIVVEVIGVYVPGSRRLR